MSQPSTAVLEKDCSIVSMMLSRSVRPETPPLGLTALNPVVPRFGNTSLNGVS